MNTFFSDRTKAEQGIKTSLKITMKLDPYLTPYIKTNSEWIKHVIIRPESINPLEEIIGGNLDIGFSNDLMDMPPKAQTTEAKTGKRCAPN